jgi:hypothetical protein
MEKSSVLKAKAILTLIGIVCIIIVPIREYNIYVKKKQQEVYKSNIPKRTVFSIHR